jgi:TonB family protein
MFEINQSVNVDATGKPLPATGSWGAQAQLPEHPTKPCALARVPCVNVLYRVPEEKIVCAWTIGFVNAIEPQPDGTIKKGLHRIVLDENDDAAHYTLRKAWSPGEEMPKPTVFQRAAYPALARDAKVGGSVVVRLIVGPDGLVKSTYANGPKLLQPAVIEAVSHWKFEPLIIGVQPTSFQLDEQFNYDAGHADFSSSMDPSGKVMVQETDPHYGPGFRSDGASSGTWQTCNAASGCTAVAPTTPK